MSAPRKDLINQMASHHGACEVLIRCGPENYRWTVHPRYFEVLSYMMEIRSGIETFPLLSLGSVCIRGEDISFLAVWTAEESQQRWEEFCAEEEHKTLTGRDI